MALTIINAEVERLAHELAHQTGAPPPQIILDALREYARHLPRQRTEAQALARIRRARQHCMALPDRASKESDPDALLGYTTEGVFDAW